MTTVRRTYTAVLFLALLIAVCMQVCVFQHSAAAQQPSDLEVADAVEDRIRLDGVIPLSRIDIKAVGGIVTLSGTLTNLLDKERAVLLAETVPGARDVIDMLTVKPQQRPDSTLEKDLARALQSNPALKQYPVGSTVTEGVVVLSGAVSSWAERELAATTAKSVAGVKDVRNDLSVRPEGQPSDQEIKTKFPMIP